MSGANRQRREKPKYKEKPLRRSWEHVVDNNWNAMAHQVLAHVAADGALVHRRVRMEFNRIAEK